MSIFQKLVWEEYCRAVKNWKLHRGRHRRLRYPVDYDYCAKCVSTSSRVLAVYLPFFCQN